MRFFLLLGALLLSGVFTGNHTFRAENSASPPPDSLQGKTSPINEEFLPQWVRLRLSQSCRNHPDSLFVHLQEWQRREPLNYPALVELGATQLAAFDFAAAEETLLKAIRLDPLSSAAYMILGDLHALQNAWHNALIYYNLAYSLPHQPENAVLLHKIAHCQQELGNDSLAVPFVLEAYRLSNGFLGSKLVDSLLDARLTDNPELTLEQLYEIYQVEDLLELLPSVEEFLMETHAVQMENQEFNNALTTARKLMELDSTRREYRLLAAQALSGLEHYSEAAELLRQTNPEDDPVLLRELAHILVLEDSLEQALPLYHRIHRWSEENVDLELEIADLYLRLEKPDSARVYLRNACRLGDSPACEQLERMQHFQPAAKDKPETREDIHQPN